MIHDLRALLPSPRRLDLMIALSVLASILQGLTFVALVPLLRALIAGDAAAGWRWVVALVAAATGFGVTVWSSAVVGQRLAVDICGNLYRRIGDKIVRLPLGVIDLEFVGRLARLTGKGVMQVATVPAHLIRPMVTALGTPVTVVVGMSLIDGRIGLVALVCLPLLALTYRYTARRVAQRDRDHAAATASAAGRIVEFARVQPALRAFRGPAGHRELERALEEQGRSYRSLLFSGAAGMGTFTLAVQVVVTALIVATASFALTGELDVATLVALQVLALRFAEPLVMVANLGSSMRISANTLQELHGILDAPELPEPDARTAPWPADPGIALRGVCFGYEPDAPVLTGITFTVAPGTTTALVGPSGAGKTTLTKLIARFHDVTAGQVLIGGVDVRELGTARTMAVVSPVFQDVYLFSGSLLDNIRMGRPGASDEEVLAAGRAAEVEEIAARLGNGWESEVGEGGGLLSGGERQRVSIARAILKDAPILLLDEATSALDPVNERAVSGALHHLAGRSRIVVAHRLDTVINADQIVVLTADGRIAEVGTHSGLLRAGGPYAHFWRTRTEAEGWTLAARR
ncbi:MAG: ABC transporter ATP-binding protein [Propionibacteriaceae bacterium]|nr:ABC transporter ATP-binding protein [Propionibacteriaceae bacterium]